MAIIIISFSIYNSLVICTLGSASLLAHLRNHYLLIVGINLVVKLVAAHNGGNFVEYI